MKLTEEIEKLEEVLYTILTKENKTPDDWDRIADLDLTIGMLFEELEEQEHLNE